MLLILLDYILKFIYLTDKCQVWNFKEIIDIIELLKAVLEAVFSVVFHAHFIQLEKVFCSKGGRQSASRTSAEVLCLRMIFA